MGDQNQEQGIVAQMSSEEQQHSVDPPTYLLSHAPCTTTTPLSCCFGSNNSVKRRSPSSSATATATATPTPTLQHRANKNLFHNSLNGFSTIYGTSFPATTLNINPCHPATAPATPFHANNAVARASSLNPLPRTPRTFSHSSIWGNSKGVILSEEQASNSMKLRRMRDCLREMSKWWDQVMLEEEGEYEDEPEEAEGDQVLLSKNDGCGGDHAEEAVSVEWAEKCLSICFKCPCTKGYQILLSGNNCYYKLV